MSDLVKRLRSRGGASGGIFSESADRIEQLEAELAALRAAPAVPGDLTKLLNEGVDDYWITLTGNRALVERLRAAAPAEPEEQT